MTTKLSSSDPVSTPMKGFHTFFADALPNAAVKFRQGNVKYVTVVTLKNNKPEMHMWPSISTETMELPLASMSDYEVWRVIWFLRACGETAAEICHSLQRRVSSMVCCLQNPRKIFTKIPNSLFFF